MNFKDFIKKYREYGLNRKKREAKARIKGAIENYKELLGEKSKEKKPSFFERLKEEDVEVIIYEPVLEQATFFNSVVEKDLLKFKSECDIIIANRISDELADVSDKMYTRDLMERD